MASAGGSALDRIDQTLIFNDSGDQTGQTNTSGESNPSLSGRVLLRGTSMGNGHYGSARASAVNSARIRRAPSGLRELTAQRGQARRLSLPRMRRSALFRAPTRVRSALQGPQIGAWGTDKKTLDSVELI
jgi:hypothetical protein